MRSGEVLIVGMASASRIASTPTKFEEFTKAWYRSNLANIKETTRRIFAVIRYPLWPRRWYVLWLPRIGCSRFSPMDQAFDLHNNSQLLAFRISTLETIIQRSIKPTCCRYMKPSDLRMASRSGVRGLIEEPMIGESRNAQTTS